MPFVVYPLAQLPHSLVRGLAAALRKDLTRATLLASFISLALW
jgi:hypothetical protein